MFLSLQNPLSAMQTVRGDGVEVVEGGKGREEEPGENGTKKSQD